MTTSYLDMSDKMYDFISEQVRKTYKNACIVWIEQIENKSQKDMFDNYVKSLPKPNIKTLFHGTNENTARAIIFSHFDPSYKKVCAYGNGLYFSTRAQYSKSYSKMNNDQLAFMFVCDIVCGKVAQGNSGKNIPKGYNSFTDNLKNPDMYIVDKAEAIWPRYLVAFYPLAK